jgi:S-adenosylmethionine hydrolase
VFISLTTDFGAASTGICAGVVHSIAPGATVQVISDEVTPYGIVEGALLLRQALPYLPVGVHIGVVDPGVGTSRRPLAVRTGRGDVLVGPDNGLLVPAAGRLGGITTARVLENPLFWLPDPSTSFHGRDIFAPAAAHLALGVDIAEMGPTVEPVVPDLPEAVTGNGELTATVLYIDRYGSLVLGADRDDLVAAFGGLAFGTPLQVGTLRVPFVETYGAVPVGEPLLWVDSSGLLGLAVNQGSAAERLGLADGATITVRRPR